MEEEMEIIRLDSGQQQPTKIFESIELRSVPVSNSSEAQNLNNEENDKNQENFDMEILPAFLFDEDRRYTKEDLKYNFLALKWAIWLKVSPFGAEETSKNFPGFRKSHKKWWQNVISYGWFLFASVRLSIGYFSTVHFGMTGNPGENLGQMTMMIIMCIIGTLVLYALAVDIVNAEIVGPFLFSVFKYLDDDAETETELQQQKKGQQKKFGLGLGIDFRRHTFIELLIILLPFPVYSISAMIPLLIIFDPSFPLVLASFVPAEISFSFLSLAAVDWLVFPYYIMIIHLIFYVFMGMHRIEEEAQLTLKNLTKTKTKTTATMTTATTTTENENDKEKSMKIQKALKSLNLLHIWTHFFNTSLSNSIYVIKLIALTASICGGFGGIQMIEVDNWPYAGIFGLAFVEGIILYNLIFGRAFEIPEKVEDLKSEIRKQSFKLFKYNSLERKYVEKYLKSIPWLGIKDGVYKMERMTCANFMIFVTEQITDLVLTY